MVNVGTVLGGRYKLDERIAGGGMGDVWRGTDEVLGRTVAVKILLPALLEEPGFAERFRGEARTMATINHPGVVDVYDYGSDPVAGAYLVMEYVEGDALSRTLSRVGRLTPGRTMALVAQAADALHAAHEKGIVHRDVKPGNLLVRPNGTLVLTDFGIARSAAVGQLTQAGAVLGTASYISPEQASGSGATPLSDLYALGVVAYQCLSGHRPFDGDNPLEIAMRHVHQQPPPLPPDTPPSVRAIVERAMAKDPAARYPTAAAFAQVARRTAAGLASTSTGLGPAGMPVSGPPVPSSPGPVGTASVPRPPTNLPGGTRVMPAYGATGAIGAGAAHRGAASVPPPPPPRPDTGYLPAQPPQSGGRGRSPVILLGTLVGVLLLLGVGLGAWALLHGTGNDRAGTAGTRTGGPATTAATLTDLQCDKAKNYSYETVRKTLEDEHFKVKRQDVPGPRGEVVDITPCQARPGDTITVKVGNGQTTSRGGGGGAGAPRPATPGASASSDGTGGGTGPTPTCTLGMGAQLGCVTGGVPNPSGSR